MSQSNAKKYMGGKSEYNFILYQWFLAFYVIEQLYDKKNNKII